MALQIWLPLKGNLDNYGLIKLDYTINTTPTYVNNGKIGQALALGQITMSAENASKILNNNEFSFACWIYVNTETGNTTNRGMLFGNSGMTAPNNRKFSIFQYPTANDLHISWQNDTNTTFTGGVWNGYFPSYKWTHLAITYKNPNGIIYINGKKTATFSGASNSASFNFNTVLFSNCPNDGRYLNDYRVYDHCLSAKEVEEISKGLILHYKLDNTGGKNNNIKYSTIMNRGCTSFTYDERKLEWTAICPVSTSSWGVGFYIGDTSIKWAYGETWVVSMEIYVPQSLNWNCDINNKPDLTDISSYTGNDYDITGQRKVNTNGIDNSKTLQPGWNKIWFSQTASNSTYGLYNYSTNWGIVTSSLTNPITIKIRNIKGEIFYSGEDIKPTFFTLNDNIFPNNIIYDSSGYQNNGISYGDIKINSNSARYSCCSYLSSGNTDYIVTQNPVGNPQDAITMNIWFKSSNKSPGADYHHMFNGLTSWCYIEMAVHKNGFLRCGLYINGTRYVANTNNTNLLDGNWHMLTMTYDGTNIKRYVDAELKNTQAAAGNIDRPNDKFIFGHGANTGYYCKETYLSDVRLYATALTIEQIKELYDTSATVDKNGNMYAREAIEL